MPDPESKTCALCGEAKPLEDYYRDRSKPDGRMWRCKTCVRAKQQTYARDMDKLREAWRRANNTPTASARSRRWQARNREKHLAARKRYRETNRDLLAAAWRAYYEANSEAVLAHRRDTYEPGKKRESRDPELMRQATRRRRARKLGAFVEEVKFDDILQRDLGICGICRKAILQDAVELDHIIPLAAGGMHERTNIQLAHPICNRRKHVKINFTLADAA